MFLNYLTHSLAFLHDTDIVNISLCDFNSRLNGSDETDRKKQYEFEKTCALLNRRCFFPLLKLPPPAGTNAVNGVLPREGPPVTRQEQGKIPPGETTSSYTAKQRRHSKVQQINSHRTHCRLNGNRTKWDQVVCTLVCIYLSLQCYFILVWQSCHFRCHRHSFVAPIYQVTKSADSCPACEIYPVIIM